jgi:hypothetical protein
VFSFSSPVLELRDYEVLRHVRIEWEKFPTRRYERRQEYEVDIGHRTIQKRGLPLIYSERAWTEIDRARNIVQKGTFERYAMDSGFSEVSSTLFRLAQSTGWALSDEQGIIGYAPGHLRIGMAGTEFDLR